MLCVGLTGQNLWRSSLCNYCTRGWDKEKERGRVKTCSILGRIDLLGQRQTCTLQGIPLSVALLSIDLPNFLWVFSYETYSHIGRSYIISKNLDFPWDFILLFPFLSQLIACLLFIFSIFLSHPFSLLFSLSHSSSTYIRVCLRKKFTSLTF